MYVAMHRRSSVIVCSAMSMVLSNVMCPVGLVCRDVPFPHITRVPAWLAENPFVGGAVFSGRTAGNDAYQPPADPPQTGPLIMPGEVLPLSFSSPSLQSNFKVSDFLLRHQGSRRKKEHLVFRDRRVDVGRLLAR